MREEVQHLEKQPHAVHPDFESPHVVAIRDNPDAPEKLSWNVILSIFFLSLSFVAPISTGFLLPTAIIVQIGTDLSDTVNVGWIASGWSVASSISFGIAGNLSDVLGRRVVVLAGQVLVLVGAIISATAQTTVIVAAGSTVIGFGCGMVFVSYAGIPELLPYKYRGVGLACTEAAIVVPWGIAAVYIANKLLEVATWRWAYYAAIIYSAVAFIGTYIVYKPPKRPQHDLEKTRWQEIKELDYVGIFLYSIGLTVFLIGLSWAGQPNHAWKSASVIAPLIVGFALFVSCFVWDFIKRPANAFLPIELFRDIRGFTLLLLIVFVAGMIFYSMSALLPQATLFIFTSDPTQIGIIALPNGFGQLLGGVIMPSLIHKIKNMRGQFIVALGLQTLFCGLYAYAVPSHRLAYSLFQLFGQGMFAWITLLCYVVAGLNVPQASLGVASGLIGVFRSGGGSVGNAIFSTILNTVVDKQLGPTIANAAIGAGFNPENLGALIPATIGNAVGVPGIYASVPGITPEVEAAAAQGLKNAYAFAFRQVFYAAIAFNVIALIAAFFVKDVSNLLTNRTAVHLEDKHGKGDEDLRTPAADSDLLRVDEQTK